MKINPDDISTNKADMIDYKSLTKRFFDTLMKQGFAVLLLVLVCAFTGWLSFFLLNRVDQIQQEYRQSLEKSYQVQIQEIKDCQHDKEEFMKAMIEELKK